MGFFLCTKEKKKKSSLSMIVLLCTEMWKKAKTSQGKLLLGGLRSVVILAAVSDTMG